MTGPKKISELNVFTAADAAVTDDYVPVVDVSVVLASDRNKRMTMTELAKALVGSASAYTPLGTGALARTVQDRLRDQVSLKDFGAVGDGVTSNNSAITNAEAANDNVVWLPYGTYKSTLTTLAGTKAYIGPGTLNLNGNTLSSAAGWLKFLGGTGGSLTMPYLLSAYFKTSGALYTGVEVVISNKRVDITGTIQAVSALADGSEPSMIAISPDINGPSIAVEAYGTLTGGHTNATAIAFYDLDSPIGGATAYSPGYGTKKAAINGKGDFYWGNDLSNAPESNYRMKLSFVPNDVIQFTAGTGVSAQLQLTAAGGEAAVFLNGPASGQSEHIDFKKNGAVQWTVWESTAATPLFVIGTPSKNIIQLRTSGSVILAAAALATNAAAGFTYLPSSAGAPSGTPESNTGTVPVEIDTTNLKLMAYIGGAWKGVALT